jgi:hypothetical protein
VKRAAPALFYPTKGKGGARWYDLGVTPTLDRFFGGLPRLEKAVVALRGIEPRSPG